MGHVNTWSSGIDREVLQLLDLAHLVRGRDEQLAERAGIDEPQVAPLLERHDDMGVRGQRHASGPALELSAHPEMHHQDVAVVQREHQVLAAAFDLRDLVSDQARRELLAGLVAPDRTHRVLGSLDLRRL